MRISFKNIFVVFILFGGVCGYYFYKSANNTKGLIINHMFTLNIIMLDQYGFSPELLRVIQKIDPSMMKYINYLYYSRLNSWRMVDDIPTNSADR